MRLFICTTTCVPTTSVLEVISTTSPCFPGPANVPKRAPSVYSTSVVDGNSFPTQIFIFSILRPHCLTSGFVIRIFRTIERGITRVIHGKMLLGGRWGSVAHTLSLVVLPSIQYEANNTSLYVEDIWMSNGVISVSGTGSPNTSISDKLMIRDFICTTTCVPTTSVSGVISTTSPSFPGPANVPKRAPPVYSTSVVDGNSFPTQIFIFSILSLHCLTSGFVIRIFRTIERGITRVIHGKMLLGGRWGSVAHTLSL